MSIPTAAPTHWTRILSYDLAASNEARLESAELHQLALRVARARDACAVIGDAREVARARDTYVVIEEARARRASVLATLVAAGASAAAKALAGGTRLLAEAIGAAAGVLARQVARGWTHYQRRRETRAIYGALSDLDDRTLRDLGFHRCEIWSVAAEATGEAAWTRVRAPLRSRRT